MSGPLIEQHDALLLDLDGVVRLGDQPIPHAAEVLSTARARGVRVVFVTNNAARSPADVATRLAALGIPATADDVVTSAVVAAHVLAGRLPRAAPVLVVGGDGLWTAITDVGLEPVRSADAKPAAVVQGWGPNVDWALLAEGAIAIRGGVPWIATNTDKTLPSPRGPLPGNGSLVAALRTATDREPEVVGKPNPALFLDAAARAGAGAPLVVGDRLDTDIAGANAAGMPSLLVFSGVTAVGDLAGAPPDQRPTYVGADLTALLLEPQERPQPQ